MNDPAQRFSNRVDDYIKYRPGYPDEAVAFIETECKLPVQATIADVGSGTGIFAKLLLDRGYKVYGVEPNAPMRSAAESLLKGYANFTSVNGDAANTTLHDKSVDLVTAATAFHWFDREKSSAEFQRILKPGGAVALLWNERQPDTDAFAQAYEDLLRGLPDYRDVNDKYSSYEQLQNFFAEGTLIRRSFPNQQTFDLEGLNGRARSSSFVPQPYTTEGTAFFEQLKDIFNRHQVNGTITFYYNTVVYVGTPPNPPRRGRP